MGAPQDCVLSLVLCILYTNDCISTFNICLTVTFADDAALVGFMKQSEIDYCSQILKK